MDTKTFLDNFGTIAEAPGGIDQLRGLVLKLGLSGALQDSGEVAREEWAILRLDEVARLEMGLTILRSDLASTGVPVYSAGQENRRWGFVENPTRKYEKGSLVLSARGSLGFPKIPDESEFISTQTTIAIIPRNIDAEFLCLSLRAVDWAEMGSGGAIPMLTIRKVSAVQILSPPLAEQKRIVAKVEELMALCDELEEKQQRKATVITKLRGSVFNALRQAETPDDLAAAWERISTNWSHLTDHPDSIPELRQTILDLAVKGRIVPSGSSWDCDSVALAEIAHVQSGFTFASGDFNQSRAGLPVIRIGDIGNSDADRYFDGEYREEFLVYAGDLLIGMSGNFNVRRWAGSTALLNQRVAKIVVDESRANLVFIMWDLQQQLDLLHKTHSFTTVPNLSMKMIKNLKLRLPPLDVQAQIVTEVDQMLAMCDELDKQLLQQQDLSRRLAVASTVLESSNAA
jgi:type I restriction enzyme S subunit